MGLSDDVHTNIVILAGAAEFVRCSRYFPSVEDWIIASPLGQETEALVERFLYNKSERVTRLERYNSVMARE